MLQSCSSLGESRMRVAFPYSLSPQKSIRLILRWRRSVFSRAPMPRQSQLMTAQTLRCAETKFRPPDLREFCLIPNCGLIWGRYPERGSPFQSVLCKCPHRLISITICSIMQPNVKCFALMIWKNIGSLWINRSYLRVCVIFAWHWFSGNIVHRHFGSVGDHFNGVNQVLAVGR